MKTLFLVAFSATLGVALLATPVRAQMDRATLESLPMPGQSSFPDYRWQNVKYISMGTLSSHISFVYEASADYGRVLLPENTQSGNPDNVWYVKVIAGANMQVIVVPFFDAPIPPGYYDDNMVWHDSCNHAHFG